MNSTAGVVSALDSAFGGFPVEFGLYMLVLGSVLLYQVFANGRVLAALLSAAVRRSFGEHYYFKVESVNFALLGGRVVFSELVYSTQNTTVRIVDGTITLRWWLYDTRHSIRDSALKPCRLQLHLSGVEYFLFNNVGRYKQLRRWLDAQADPSATAAPLPLNDLFDASLIAVPGYFKLFPTIGITLTKAALMIGNPELPAIVLVQAPRGGGVYACDRAASAHDGYKWIVGLQLAGATTSILSNAEYLRDEELVAVDESARKASERARALSHRFRDFMYKVSSPTFMSTRSTGAVPRLVERKPRVETLFEDGAANLRELDVLSCRDLRVVYRVDANGWWPADYQPKQSARDEPAPAAAAAAAAAARDDDESASTGSGEEPSARELPVDERPPEWALEIDATGAQFTYGPWADRQRALTSRFFFPLDYKPLERVKRAAGRRREHEALDVTLNLIDEFGIRVPFRTAPAMAGTLGARGAALDVDDSAAIASLSISGRDGVVRYVAPMFLNARHAQRTTCRTDATLRTTQPLVVTTSIRHADAPLLRANGLHFRLAMHQQAVWNAENLYAFRIRLSEPRIFVTDVDVRFLKQMAADWVLTTQLKPTLALGDFVPTLYALDVTLSDFRLHINTNEMNVVARENDLDDNAHLLLTGPTLRLDVDYPALLFGAVATTVTVRVRAPHAQMRHMYAEHHTVRLFAPGGALAPASVAAAGAAAAAAHDDAHANLRRDGLRFITLQQIDVTVAYKYHHEVRAGWRDSMQLTARAAHAELVAHGHFLRHMLYWLDNFLGAARKRRSPARWRDIWSGAQPATPRVYLPENEFEMGISVDIDRVALVLPTHLYNLDNAARADTTKFHLAVQYVALFIDIAITAEPIHLRVPQSSTGAAPATTFRALDLPSRSGLCVSGLAVRVHYLFGPAPRELTYQRIISINIGSVAGHVLPAQLLTLGDGFAQLGMHFKDHDNSVTWDYFPQEVPYHTSVRVKIGRVHLHVWGGASVAELLVQDGVHVAVDELRRRTHDVSVDVHLVGGAAVTCLVPKTAPAFALAADWRHWREVGRVCVPRIAVVASLGPPVDAAATQHQIDYLKEQDKLSKRIWWLWHDAPPGDAQADAAADVAAANNTDSEIERSESSMRRQWSGRRSDSQSEAAKSDVAEAAPAAAPAQPPKSATPPVPHAASAPAAKSRAALVQSENASGRRSRAGTSERLPRSLSQASIQRSRANSEADVFGTPEASIDDEDDEFGSVDDDVAGFIARAGGGSQGRARRMTAQQSDVARSVAMVASVTRSMLEASAPLVPPVAAHTRTPSPRRPSPPLPASTVSAPKLAGDDESESDSWWRENTSATHEIRDGVYAPLFRLLASQRPLLRRAQLDEMALDATGVGFEGAPAGNDPSQRRAVQSAFVHERDGMHEYLKRQRALPDAASAFAGDGSDDASESDTALSDSAEPAPPSNPTDIANLHELIEIIRASRGKKARKRAKEPAAAVAAEAPANGARGGYTRHDVASNTAAARVVVDLADVVEVLLTPLFMHAIDDWLALLAERQASVDTVLDGMQRSAIEAAAPAISRACGDKAAPPHDELSLAIGLRGVHVSLVQSVRTSASAATPLFVELLLQRTRISATVCFRSFVGAHAATVLPPKELCHAHVGASLDGLYGCARRVARNRRAVSGMRGVLPTLLDEARTRAPAGAAYVGETLVLENEWSQAAPSLLLLLCVPPSRVSGTFVGPGARSDADADGRGALSLDVAQRPRLLLTAAAGAPTLACARLWSKAVDRAAERATVLAEIERLRLAAVVEGIVLGRVAAHKRQRAATQADVQPVDAFDFDSLVLLKKPDGAVDERYRFRLHPVALVRREAYADVARLRECLSLMPPRRRQAIDALLSHPLQLLSDTAQPSSPAQPAPDVAAAAAAAAPAPHSRSPAELAQHNTQVVARCLARYRAFVDAGTKSAPPAVQELVTRPLIRRCFAPPLAAARHARKEQLARQPDHTPQLSGFGRALFAVLGRDGTTVLPPRSSIDVRVALAGGDVLVLAADGDATSVRSDAVSVRAAMHASLDSCRNASGGVQSVYGLLRVEARWHADMGKVRVHVSNAALRFAAGLLEAAAVWDGTRAPEALRAPPPAIRDGEPSKQQSRRHKTVMIDTNTTVHEVQSRRDENDAPASAAAASPAAPEAAAVADEISIDELDLLLPPHLLVRAQAAAAQHSPFLAAGVDETAPVALLTSEANLTENRYEQIVLHGVVQLPAIVATATVGESAAASVASGAASTAAPVAFDAHLRILPVVVSTVRHYDEEGNGAGEQRVSAFLMPSHTNATVMATGALLVLREGRVHLASIKVSPITVSASRREQSAGEAVRAAKPFISAAAMASPRAGAPAPGEEQFADLLQALDQEPQRAAVAAHVRGVHARIDASRVARLAGVVAVLDEALAATKPSAAAAPTTTSSRTEAPSELASSATAPAPSSMAAVRITMRPAPPPLALSVVLSVNRVRVSIDAPTDRGTPQASYELTRLTGSLTTCVVPDRTPPSSPHDKSPKAKRRGRTETHQRRALLFNQLERAPSPRLTSARLTLHESSLQFGADGVASVLALPPLSLSGSYRTSVRASVPAEVAARASFGELQLAFNEASLAQLFALFVRVQHELDVALAHRAARVRRQRARERRLAASLGGAAAAVPAVRAPSQTALRASDVDGGEADVPVSLIDLRALALDVAVRFDGTRITLESPLGDVVFQLAKIELSARTFEAGRALAQHDGKLRWKVALGGAAASVVDHRSKADFAQLAGHKLAPKKRANSSDALSDDDSDTGGTGTSGTATPGVVGAKASRRSRRGTPTIARGPNFVWVGFATALTAQNASTDATTTTPAATASAAAPPASRSSKTRRLAQPLPEDAVMYDPFTAVAVRLHSTLLLVQPWAANKAVLLFNYWAATLADARRRVRRERAVHLKRALHTTVEAAQAGAHKQSTPSAPFFAMLNKRSLRVDIDDTLMCFPLLPSDMAAGAATPPTVLLSMRKFALLGESSGRSARQRVVGEAKLADIQIAYANSFALRGTAAFFAHNASASYERCGIAEATGDVVIVLTPERLDVAVVLASAGIAARVSPTLVHLPVHLERIVMLTEQAIKDVHMPLADADESDALMTDDTTSGGAAVANGGDDDNNDDDDGDAEEEEDSSVSSARAADAHARATRARGTLGALQRVHIDARLKTDTGNCVLQTNRLAGVDGDRTLLALPVPTLDMRASYVWTAAQVEAEARTSSTEEASIFVEIADNTWTVEPTMILFSDEVLSEMRKVSAEQLRRQAQAPAPAAAAPTPTPAPQPLATPRARIATSSTSDLRRLEAEGKLPTAPVEAPQPSSQKVTVHVRLRETRLALSCAPVKENVVCALELGDINVFLSSQSKIGSKAVNVQNATVHLQSVALLLHRQHVDRAGANDNAEAPSIGFVMRNLRCNIGRAIGLKTTGGAFVSALLDVASLRFLLNLRHFDDVFLFQQIWLSKLSQKARTNVGSLIEDAYALDHRVSVDALPTAAAPAAPTKSASGKAVEPSKGSLFAAMSLFVNARVRQVLFEADLQLTGKVAMTAQNLALDVGLPHTDTSTARGHEFASVLKVKLGLGATDITSRGSLSGQAQTQGIVCRATSSYRGGDAAAMLGRLEVTATVAPLRARFAYNRTDILLLRFGTLNLSLNDRAPPSDAAREAPRARTADSDAPRDVLLDVELSQGDLCVACETIYCAVAVVSAVRDNVAKQRTKTLKLVKRRRADFAAKAPATIHERFEADVAELAAQVDDDEDEFDGVEALLQQGGAKSAAAKPAASAAAPVAARPAAPTPAAADDGRALVIPVGVINLHTQQMRVSLFDSLADPAWLTLTMESAQLLLDQHLNRRGAEGIHRELSLILGESRLSKMSEGGASGGASGGSGATVASTPAADTWIDSRHAHAHEAAIFTLPASTLIMYSHQRVRSSRVEFYFVTDFESSVHVAITGVDYIPEIVQLYNNAVDEAKRLVVVRAPHDAAETGSRAKAVSQGGLQASSDGAAADAAAPVREFVCKKFVLNPILNSIRHTPSIDTVLEWLKVRNSREFIPYHTHVLFTDPLEGLLTALWNLATEVEVNTLQVVRGASAATSDATTAAANKSVVDQRSKLDSGGAGEEDDDDDDDEEEDEFFSEE